MKKHIITGLMVALLATVPPCNVQAQSNGKDNIVMIGCSLIVIGVGIVVIIGLKKMCDHIPPVDQQPTNNVPPMPPVPTNNIPTNSIPTNKPPWYKRLALLEDSQVGYYDITWLGLSDTNCGYAAPVIAYTVLRFQESRDMATWNDLLYGTSWLSSAGTEFVWANTNHTPILTNYCRLGDQVQTPVSIGDGNDPQHFYRLLSTQ